MLTCCSRSEVIVNDEMPTSNFVLRAGMIVGNSECFVSPALRPMTLASALLMSMS